MALSPEERLAALTADHKRAIYELLRDAEDDVTRRLYAAVDRGADGTARKLKTVQQEIHRNLAVVDGSVKGWATRAARDVYQGAMHVTDARVGRAIGAGISGSIGWDAPLHVEALDLLAQAAYTPFQESLHRIGRRVDDDFQKAGLQQARVALVGGSTQGSMARSLRASLASQGHFDFTDKSGRVWNLKRYSEMVSRTVLREAETQGSANRMVQMGVSLGEVSYDANPCGHCTEWQGRILDLDGSAKGKYPTMEDARAGGLWHPNCRHNIMPHVPDVDAMMKNLEAYLDEGAPPPAPAPAPVAKATPANGIQGIKDEAARLHAMADQSPETVALQARMDAAKAAEAAKRHTYQTSVTARTRYLDEIKRLEAQVKDPSSLPDWLDVADIQSDLTRNRQRLVDAEERVAHARASLDDVLAQQDDLRLALRGKGSDWDLGEVQARKTGSLVRLEAENRTAGVADEIKDLEAKRTAANARAAAIQVDPEVTRLYEAFANEPMPSWRDGPEVWEASTISRKATQKAWVDKMAELGLQEAQGAAKDAGIAIRALEVRRSEAYFDVLREVRDFGATGKNLNLGVTPTGLKRLVQDKIAPYFPTTWWKTGGEIRFSQIRGRAFCDFQNRWARIGPDGHAGVHEVTHHFEYRIPGLYDLVEAFYKRRCTNPDGTLEPLLKLSRLTGQSGYKASEVARRDKWPEPYMGKEYPYKAHEIITCGLDDLAAGKASWLTDPDQADLLDFCLGILAGVG